MSQASLEKFTEVVEDLKLLKASSIGDGSVSSMEKAREQRIEELKDTNGTLEEGYKRILNDLNRTRERRHLLREYYETIKDVLHETQVMCPKEKVDFLAGAEECIADLENKRFVVLIAGETSAGKSSMINLLLNDRVLPTRIIKNTLTICEISYGPRKEGIVYFAKPEKMPLKLEENEFDAIKQYIEKPRNDEQWCKKIEIKIPNPLLQDGIVIVDSPGIGDSEDASKIALEYLPQASAFIYVINSPNAGGLQEDRLLRIVKEWIKLYREGKHKPITGESALFVCNKWDEVERNASYDQCEKDDLQKHIILELKKKIPDLDEESQVIKMSVNTATQVQQKFNVMSDDLNSLIDGIQRLLLLCIEKKMEQFYRWISGHLTSMSDQVKGKIKNAKRNREERLKARKEVDEKLKEFKKEVSIRNTEEALSNHVIRISERVKSYLKSDDVGRAFCKWTEKDLPHVGDDQRGSEVELKKIYKECIEQRLEVFLEKLENKEKLFAKAHAELQELFHRGFFDFEKDIRNIDEVLVGESMDEIKNDKLCPPLDERVKKFLVLTSASFVPVLFPIGMAAGVLSAPVFWCLADGEHLKKQYLETNPCQALEKLSTEFLQAFIAHNIAHHVKQEFTDENNRISSIRSCHQELIDRYEKKCKDLTKSEDEAMANQNVETLDALRKKLQDMNENLMFDAIQHGIQVMYPPCQIDKRRLQCTEETLGKGSYGTVYKGKFRPLGRRRKNVAVKNLSEAPEPSNVASFLGEAAMLMQLKHKNIVRFYGVAMDVNNHELISLSLVFKLCMASLKDRLFDNEKYIPLKTASAVAVTCQWSVQILDALEFIHSKNIVHRDLKVDNVLISRRERIKIADLGLATSKSTITGTMCGTPLYLAPEVKQGKVYDSKVDIYSFGIMMWEMWFGKRAAKDLSSKSANEVIRQIEKRRAERPFNPPSAKWVELMASCWHSDPCLRPTATKSKDLFEELKRDFVK